MSDLRNQDGFELIVGESEASLDLKLRSECFRPRRREDDLGLRGSTASAKKSCSIACFEVGRFFGSHIRHQVTKLLKASGQCGGWRIVSIAWGAIWTPVSHVASVSRDEAHLPLEKKSKAFELALSLLSIHLLQLDYPIWYTSFRGFP